MKKIRAIALASLGLLALATLSLGLLGGSDHAQAIPSPLLLPFSVGETWYVCQGYNGQISHFDAPALDLSVDPNSPGPTGCTLSTADASTGRFVTAAGAGQALHWDFTDPVTGVFHTDFLCINFDAGGSVLLGHMGNRVGHGTHVSAGQQVGTVNGPDNMNGRYAHIHVQAYSKPNCDKTAKIAFSDANGARFQCAPDMPYQGTPGDPVGPSNPANQYSGQPLTRCAIGLPIDIYFLVDLSGSFSDDLPLFKAQAPDIISTLATSNPNSRFGLGKFEDYPIPPFGYAFAGDKAYERLVDLTFDTDLVLDTISGLFTRFGGDGPQSQLPALYQAATGAGQDLSALGFPEASIPPGQQANFRDGATKLILLWTDAPFHRPGDPGDIPYPGPSFGETVGAILALDPPKVIGISSGPFGIPDLEEIAAATGGVAPPDGVDCDGDGTIDIAGGEPLVCSIAPSGEGIGEAITALVEAATEAALEIDIKPGSDPNSINPKSRGVIPVAILTTEDFDAATVDPETVVFADASPVHYTVEDVDRDGDNDLILHFRTQDTGIAPSDTEACLTGETLGGVLIEGCDSVRTVP